MRLCVLSVIVGVFAELVLVLAQVTVNTPVDIVACQPILLNWSGGMVPYYVSILSARQPTASALETISSGTTSTSLTWNVDIAPGTSIMIVVRDATGSITYSDPVIIQAGSSASCLANAGDSALSSIAGVALSAVSVVLSAAATSAAVSSVAIVGSTLSTAALSTSSTTQMSITSESIASTFTASGISNTPTSQTTTSTSGTGATGGGVTQTNITESPSNRKSNSKTIAIAVGVVAGVLAIAVVVLVYPLVRRNRRRRDPQLNVNSSLIDQHDGGQPGMGMYRAASGFLHFVPASRELVSDDLSKVDQPPASSQSDASAPHLTSPQPESQQQQSQSLRSSNPASSSQSHLENPALAVSSSSQPPRAWGGGLVSQEKSGLPGLPPGASPPIPGGVESMFMRGLMTPDSSLYHLGRSPPPQYEDRSI